MSWQVVSGRWGDEVGGGVMKWEVGWQVVCGEWEVGWQVVCGEWEVG